MNPKLDPENQSATFCVAGDLLSTNAEALRSEIGGWLDNSHGEPQMWSTFVLDLTAAKMVDSVGLNLVVTVLKRVQKLGAKMQVAYSNQNVLRTFTFTRLDKHLELVKG
jgi:anti-anti-sigma factor